METTAVITKDQTKRRKKSGSSPKPVAKDVSLRFLTDGNCESSSPDALFEPEKYQQDAKKICTGCVVIEKCLAYALDNDEHIGLWGGMTEGERKKLVKSLFIARTERRKAGRQVLALSWAEMFARDRARQAARAKQAERMLLRGTYLMACINATWPTVPGAVLPERRYKPRQLQDVASVKPFSIG